MTSEVLTQAIAAGGTVTFGQGRIFNLLSAPGGPVTITAERRSIKGGQTQVRKFVSIPAGSKFTADKGDEWTFLRVTSASAQTITLFVGDEDMQFNNAVTVTGTAVVAINPSSALATVNVAPFATASSSNVAANPARRRITVCAPTTNTGLLYVQTAGFATANAGIPLSPGTFVELDTTASFDVRNDSGANQGYSTIEET